MKLLSNNEVFKPTETTKYFLYKWPLVFLFLFLEKAINASPIRDESTLLQVR